MNNINTRREYFRAFYRGNRLLWLAAMGITILSTPVNLAFSWLLGQAADAVMMGEPGRMLELIRFTVVLLAAVAVVESLQSRLKAVFVHRALSGYKSFAFARLSRKSISAFARENTARYLSVLTNDIGSIEENYLNRTFLLVYHVLIFVGSIVMMFWYSPKLALLSIGLSLIPMLLSVTMGSGLSRREKAVSDQSERYVALLKDMLAGFTVLKSFKAEREARRLFDEISDETERCKLRRRWWECLLTVVQSGCGVSIQLGLMFIGGYMAIQGEITLGSTMTVMNLVNFVVQPINIVPQYWASRKAAKTLISKLASVAEDDMSRSGDTIEPVLEDAITMEQLCFAYEPGKPVLKDINLRIEAGKKYAIVGASGSGKSTLLNLLMGASDGYTGRIAIDGKELRTIDPDSLYDLVSLIGQNVFLFDQTIRENITMFRTFPDDAVESAVKRSGLAAVIAAKGDNYRCGENGVSLSGGERQRISIARSLLRGTPVLMLDEATAALDNQTAFEITDAMLHLDGLTRIVVTHRLEEALLRQYDGIIVLRDGKVCEQGTYESLMAKTGYFYSLYHVSN